MTVQNRMRIDLAQRALDCLFQTSENLNFHNPWNFQVPELTLEFFNVVVPSSISTLFMIDFRCDQIASTARFFCEIGKEERQRVVGLPSSPKSFNLRSVLKGETR